MQIKAAVLRDGREIEIPVEEIVPGDIIILNAGDMIPADCLILDSNDLFVSEATLTGESYPVEKSVGALKAEIPLAQRINSLWMGTSVVSGSGKALVVFTKLPIDRQVPTFARTPFCVSCQLQTCVDLGRYPGKKAFFQLQEAYLKRENYRLTRFKI